ncbi:MAG: PD40 domain-containing protein [Nitrospirae bacterium]|nr:PD40 domain-containing protein [Nitrospirota bacterium]
MYKRLVFIILAIVILDILGIVDAIGFDSNYTHPTITRLAIGNIVEQGRIDRYLRDDIGLTDGLETSFLFRKGITGNEPINEEIDRQIERNNNVPGKDLGRVYKTRFEEPYTAKYLIISGSEAEDHPTERSQHHFLDPVSNEGLNNNYYGVGVLADFLALFYPATEQGNAGRLICSLMSLCEPAFNLDGTSAVERVEGKTSNAYPYNYFAWPDTRSYYYKAFTAKTKEERENYLALTFFSLGHSLHILEDMAVPAHTRNDFLYDHIWHGLIQGSYLEGYAESERMVEKVTYSADRASFERVADFWDNDGRLSIPGLAEYTNQNFLSEGTVFNIYERPDWVSIDRYEAIAEDGQKDFVRYYTGKTSDGIDIPHLAAAGLLHSAFEFIGDKERAKYTAYLDPYCYRDYSGILIPKAASYVEGLIEYFFRGRIAVIKDGPDIIRIKNISAGPVNGGVFEIYYDSSTGIRTMLTSYEIAQGNPLMPGGITEWITLNQPSDNITQGRYIVVFKGRLGEEDGAVFGKVISDRLLFISERSGASELYSMGMDGDDTRPLLSNRDPAIMYTHPVGSPDGTMIAFHSNLDGTDGIWILDITTGNIRRIADGYWPDWSPDGGRIVYSKKVDGKSDIFIVDIETGGETRLTDDSYNNLWPSWSPDGSRIAYTSQREGRGDIIVVELNSMTALNLTASLDSLDRWKPSWSPDGRMIAYEKPTKIVYALDEPWYVNIYLLEIDTGQEINITNTDSSNTGFGVWNGTPHWIDNKRIVIESNISGEPWSDLWVIDASGSGFMQRLTNTPGHDGYPFFW